ncbi:MAG: hypothetical protein Q9191_007728 [Dirinaria sp. TL-2023a]
MALLEQYIQKIYDYEPKHPSHVPKGHIFPPTRSAPQLDSMRLNRIIIYNGSFNPPHRGHLRLLKHTFYHGAHGLNVIGAIIRPLGDEHVIRKCEKAGGSFVFGREERSMLWKQDFCFPDWAWVYEAGCGTLSGFLSRLKDVASEDGFDIEYILLAGPSKNDHLSPPEDDDFSHGATTLIKSDAARLANYQRSCGRIKDFICYTRWKRLPFKVESLKSQVRQNMQRALDDKATIHPEEAYRMLEDAGATFVEEATEEAVKSMMSDMKNILCCYRAGNDEVYTIRFVKAERRWCQEKKNYTSSSELREAMSNLPSKYLKAVLDEMALSADVLWRCKSQWVEEAKAQESNLIAFDALVHDIPDTLRQEKDQVCGSIDDQEVSGMEEMEEEISQQESTRNSQEEAAQENQEQPKKRKHCESVDVSPSAVKDSKMARRGSKEQQLEQAESKHATNRASPTVEQMEEGIGEHEQSQDERAQDDPGQPFTSKQSQKQAEDTLATNGVSPAVEPMDDKFEEHPASQDKEAQTHVQDT